MNFDDLLQRYFAATDLATVSPAMLETGLDRLQVDFGLETDRAKRFALWSLLFMLGATPDLEASFDDPGDRDAARNLMDLMDGPRDV